MVAMRRLLGGSGRSVHSAGAPGHDPAAVRGDARNTFPESDFARDCHLQLWTALTFMEPTVAPVVCCRGLETIPLSSAHQRHPTCTWGFDGWAYWSLVRKMISPNPNPNPNVVVDRDGVLEAMALASENMYLVLIIFALCDC